MKRKNLIIAALILIISFPFTLVYLTFANSKDCSQLVVDTYEVHSGIDIPDVDFVNCYYDEATQTRISVYQLNASMDLSGFQEVAFRDRQPFLLGENLLSKSEQPKPSHLYGASGSKWGRKWSYLLDEEAGRLWASIEH